MNFKGAELFYLFILKEALNKVEIESIITTLSKEYDVDQNIEPIESQINKIKKEIKNANFEKLKAVVKNNF